jgi:hypothetical protein
MSIFFNNNQRPINPERTLSEKVKDFVRPKLLSPLQGEPDTFLNRVKELFKPNLKSPATETDEETLLNRPKPAPSPSTTPVVAPVFAQEKTPAIAPMPIPAVSPMPTFTRPFEKEATEVWGDKVEEFYRVMKEGENAKLQPVIDVPNRTIKDPVTGKKVWNNAPDAPIDQIYNPDTDKMEDSIDRGLARINNGTFYLLLNSLEYRPMMKEAGITDTNDVHKVDFQVAWDKMNDPGYNIKMSKIIYQFHENENKKKGIKKSGWSGWVAAPEDLVNLEEYVANK